MVDILILPVKKDALGCGENDGNRNIIPSTCKSNEREMIAFCKL